MTGTFRIHNQATPSLWFGLVEGFDARSKHRFGSEPPIGSKLKLGWSAQAQR